MNMKDNTQTLTIALKTCSVCNTQFAGAHRFCRMCGADQSLPEFSTRQFSSDSSQSSNAGGLAPNNEQEALSPTGYSSLSGSILNSLAMLNLPVIPSWIKSQIAKKTVTAAIAFPLWLMIILLSPLDALEASRRVTRRL